MRGFIASSFVAFMLVVLAISGVITGGEADSRAEIERAFSDPPEINWEEQEDPRLKYVPEKYTEPLESGPISDSTWFGEYYRTSVQGLLDFMFLVAKESALFGYTHSWFFGNNIVQAGLQGLAYVALFAVVGVQLVRVRRIYRGVEG